MATAAVLYWLLRLFSLPLDVRTVCVFVGPLFAGHTVRLQMSRMSVHTRLNTHTRRTSTQCLVSYAFGKELSGPGAGLLAAAMMSIVPGYVSRSAAGSYDNEAVSIFALLLTFWLFVKAIKTGTWNDTLMSQCIISVVTIITDLSCSMT